MSGPVPYALLELQATLRELNLAGNQFSGKVPVEIGQCDKLEYLYLHSNLLDCSEIAFVLAGLTRLVCVQSQKNTYPPVLHPSTSTLSSSSRPSYLFTRVKTGIGVARDYTRDTETLENILITGRTVGFITAEIGYINYSYSRAQHIFEATLTSSMGKGLHWAVKTVPILFLPTVLFRAAFVFVSSSEEAASIFSMSRWYAAATAIVTVLLDAVFLISFVLFLRANSPSEPGAADNSTLIIARYGATSSFIFLGAAGTFSAYAEQVNPSLRFLSFTFLTVVSVILTCLKWKLHCERVCRMEEVDARLKGVLGEEELRRIRSREVFVRPVGEGHRGFEEGDVSATVSDLDDVKYA
ncbi:hypothetical protein HDU81_009048 [Chytriomyces hyalinus]|nr:hypothetical protein HDU81_009048 [Chytriomyces hyalinus]